MMTLVSSSLMNYRIEHCRGYWFRTPCRPAGWHTAIGPYSDDHSGRLFEVSAISVIGVTVRRLGSEVFWGEVLRHVERTTRTALTSFSRGVLFPSMQGYYLLE
jgi:hypothetical protein